MGHSNAAASLQFCCPVSHPPDNTTALGFSCLNTRCHIYLNDLRWFFHTTFPTVKYHNCSFDTSQGNLQHHSAFWHLAIQSLRLLKYSGIKIGAMLHQVPFLTYPSSIMVITNSPENSLGLTMFPWLAHKNIVQ